MYHYITKCRACGSTDLNRVFNLGLQPLANDFRRLDEEHAGHAPLEVMLCERCYLGQLSIVVDSHSLYHHYCYTTSRSQMMADHFASLCADIKAENGAGAVLEIGSNDGLFLRALKRHGFSSLLGVDPASNLATSQDNQEIGVVVMPWGEQAAEKASMIIGRVDSVVARHVFCHVDDWKGFINAFECVSHCETLVCIEVPYARDMLERREFDTIYHEHLSYFTIRSMSYLLKDTNWHMHRINRYPIHGGSIVVMLRRNDTQKPIHSSIGDFFETEGYTTVGRAAWSDFDFRSMGLANRVQATVGRCMTRGKKICGFGASAKSTVLINAANIGSMISFITDTTPEKIGRFSPNSSIPIVGEEELMAQKPDYAIMFAWNYRAEILERMKPYLQAGGHFIIPVPEVEIV